MNVIINVMYRITKYITYIRLVCNIELLANSVNSIVRESTF